MSSQNMTEKLKKCCASAVEKERERLELNSKILNEQFNLGILNERQRILGMMPKDRERLEDYQGNWGYIFNQAKLDGYNESLADIRKLLTQ